MPFLAWLPELKNTSILRADIIAGITVALVLIPQSMAYASLAGLPPYYGLYAAFMPPIVGAIFGSSRQLATGPVAVVSLMTAAALEPLATAGGEAFIAYAILLALMVGLFQLSLGLLRLGVLVNFLAHPVVVGFTNAAAIIIATSQLGKIFGVSVEKMPHHYETVWNTIIAAIHFIHWPTLAMAVLAFAIMIILKRINPKIPGVLAAVVITTLVALLTDFQKLQTIKPSQIASNTTLESIDHNNQLKFELAGLSEQIFAAEKKLGEINKQDIPNRVQILDQQHLIENLRLQKEQAVISKKINLQKLKTTGLVQTTSLSGDSGLYYAEDEIPAGSQKIGPVWHIQKLESGKDIGLHTGGKVVGSIPQGLPSFKIPTFDWSIILQLVSVAIAIALIGFMEAISIAKAMAARTRQRLDANQELIGQGLSNIVGSFFQSYPASGSFSRSAVNISAGAITGFSSVVTSLVVVITLLWLTPLLYNLPQATLAAVIMMAVIGLVNIEAVKHAWHASKHDGAVSVITFVLTLAFAPHLDKGIIIGVGLSLVLYLYRSMEPRVVFLSRHTDGTLRDAQAFNLQCCEEISILRFEGSLYFANTSYFESKVQEMLSRKPEMKYLIIDGVSINQMDATGQEMLREINRNLGESGVEVLFTRFKQPVMNMLRETGLVEEMGKDKFYRRPDSALTYIWEKLGEDHAETCPLNIPMPITEPEAENESEVVTS
ncbi:MAG: STAS domain-containing protein [Gammaproteobacteria bacterium]|nr:STAS domain-containing protein [Gammaproteobacteria bacterium]